MTRPLADVTTSDKSDGSVGPVKKKSGISLIIPAHNEEQRIGRVLEVVTTCDYLDEIVVVNDGSIDRTSKQARRYSRVTVFDLPKNLGKGGAMYAGVMLSRQPTIVFLDADLIGLQREHVQSLALPVAGGEADMALALFHGGRFQTDLSHRLTAWVTGQRAVRRDLIAELPQIAAIRSGVETVISRHAHRSSWKIRKVHWEGVTHVMREEKLGALPGLWSRLRMYGDITRALLNGAPNNDCVAVAEQIHGWIAARGGTNTPDAH